MRGDLTSGTVATQTRVDVPALLRLAQTGDRSWMDRSACRDAVTSPDDDVFFPPDFDESGRSPAVHASQRTRHERAALQLCADCPVQLDCLAYAVSTRQRFGVWGGRTEAQLQALMPHAGTTERRQPTDVGTRRGGHPGVPRPHARRSHCPVGHPYNEVNTYVSPAGKRHCLTCRRARALVQQRQLTAKRTHCPQGHAYDDANTALDARGRRKCRACTRARAQAESRWIASQRDRRVSHTGKGRSS